MKDLTQWAPPYEADAYSAEEQRHLAPFFTNLDQSVYVPLIFSPEIIGALCSRTSRAAKDLRQIFLSEYVAPFLEPVRSEKESAEEWQAKKRYGQELKGFIAFLQEHPIEQIFSNPRARSFYIKWLAQYGDDSIAQMAGMHLVYSSLSQLAIKHFEDQRIGLAPIEKSTRYVDYATKINGHYRYYTDPKLIELGLVEQYRAAMDGLFDTYTTLRPQVEEALAMQYPDETPQVIQTKAFDTLRGLLPVATLSQVAFFGNGQSFEYAVSRSLKHPLGEVRWAGERAYDELYTIVPSFLRRIKDDDSAARQTAEEYQEYLAGQGRRMTPFVDKHISALALNHTGPSVRLVDFDPNGETNVIAGMLYHAPNNHRSWEDVVTQVMALSTKEQADIVSSYLAGRNQRWQKVGRALEHAFVRFEITMNIGAWRDLHRHRMQTQQRQHFTTLHGYDVPSELIETGLDAPYRVAMEQAATVYESIAQHDTDMAQYAVPMAYRVRFMQYANLRACFWEMELRTIPEGHPDYRAIEQEKFRQLKKVYPLLVSHMHVNLENYTFARRGQEEKIQAKLKSLTDQRTS